jgi:hypothetical protein
MRKTTKINQGIDYEDINCILNIVQRADLEKILELTPGRRRLDVSLSFSGIEAKDLIKQVGIYDGDSPNSVWRRWFRHEHRLPLGAAVRMAKVFGVPTELLFQSSVWHS